MKVNGRVVVAVLLAGILLAGALVSMGMDPVPAAADEPYSSACYNASGGALRVAGSGCEFEFQSGSTIDVQSGTTATFANLPVFSGGIDLAGGLLDLDADNDTSLQVSTDDQVDVEIGGADIQVWKQFGAATIETTTTTHLVEIVDSTPVMSDATNTLSALNIDLGIGNSTGGTNSVYGILIDGITADAQNTETAISVGSGWDNDIVTAGGVDLGGVVTLANDETIDNTTDGVINFNADLQTEAGHKIYPENATNASVVYVAENTLAYTDSTSKTMFILPADVNLVDWQFIVDTQFNDSGTDTINCGISPADDADDYVDGLDGESAGINRMGDAGDMPIASDGDVGASDVTVVCYYTGQNSNSDAGAATLRMFYRVD